MNTVKTVLLITLQLALFQIPLKKEFYKGEIIFLIAYARMASINRDKIDKGKGTRV